MINWPLGNPWRKKSKGGDSLNWNYSEISKMHSIEYFVSVYGLCSLERSLSRARDWTTMRDYCCWHQVRTWKNFSIITSQCKSIFNITPFWLACRADIIIFNVFKEHFLITFKKIPSRSFCATLILQNIKVAPKPLDRIFLNFLKKCSLICKQFWCNKKEVHRLLFV